MPKRVGTNSKEIWTTSIDVQASQGQEKLLHMSIPLTHQVEIHHLKLPQQMICCIDVGQAIHVIWV